MGQVDGIPMDPDMCAVFTAPKKLGRKEPRGEIIQRLCKLCIICRDLRNISNEVSYQNKRTVQSDIAVIDSM